jgi:adenine phosphoribosyltransferase
VGIAGHPGLRWDPFWPSGAQLQTLQALIQDCGATWVGASVLIDNLGTGQRRRLLNLHAVFHIREP